MIKTKKKTKRVAQLAQKAVDSVLGTTVNMSFGQAIAQAQAGNKIAREGWNGKKMWVIYVPGTKKAELREGTPYKTHLKARKYIEILPHFDMFTADKKMLPGWLASQRDLDSVDWYVVK